MKQKNGRRLSALVVAAAMSVLILPATALADYGYTNSNSTEPFTSAVASITVEDTTYYYAFLSDAINDAQDGDTVTLLKDVTLSYVITISNKTITLDLNGNNITKADNFSGTYLLNVSNGATLTVTGSGEISGAVGGIKTDGTLNVEDGTISGTTYGIYVSSNGTLTVSGGTITCGFWVIYNDGGTVTFTGGTFDEDVSAYLTEDYAMLVEDGTYTVMTVEAAQASAVATATVDEVTYYYLTESDVPEDATDIQYKVTFVNADEDKTVLGTAWVAANGNVAEEDVPTATLEGYTFTGWSDGTDADPYTATQLTSEYVITSVTTFTAAYTVDEAATEETETEGTTEEDETTEEEETEETVASTGDDTNILVFGSIALLAAAGAVVARKKLYVK